MSHGHQLVAMLSHEFSIGTGRAHVYFLWRHLPSTLRRTRYSEEMAEGRAEERRQDN